MSRFFTPALLLVAAAGVLVYNQRPDRQMVFPLLDRVVQSPYTQGQITVAILALLGGVSLLMAIAGVYRERKTED